MANYLMLDAEILTTFSLVSPNPADLGWFPLGLSWRWGVMSLHLHWYKIPFSLTAISSVLNEAILTNRNLSLALDFSGQNSRSSPSHNGVWFAPESPAEIIGINKNKWTLIHDCRPVWFMVYFYGISGIYFRYPCVPLWLRLNYHTPKIGGRR